MDVYEVPLNLIKYFLFDIIVYVIFGKTFEYLGITFEYEKMI